MRVREQSDVKREKKKKAVLQLHLPRCHTSRGRTFRGCGRRTDRLRWCRASPWAAASPSVPWWWLWSDPHWWQSARWEPRRLAPDPQTHLNAERQTLNIWTTLKLRLDLKKTGSSSRTKPEERPFFSGTNVINVETLNCRRKRYTLDRECTEDEDGVVLKSVPSLLNAASDF